MFKTLYESEEFFEWQMLSTRIVNGCAKLCMDTVSMTFRESLNLHPCRVTREPFPHWLGTAVPRLGQRPDALGLQFRAPLRRIYPQPPAHMEELPAGLIADEI